MILEHHADVAAQLRNAAPAHVRELRMVDDDLPARRPFDEADQFQERALAGARMAGHEHHLAGADLEAELGERVLAGGIAFADLVEGDHSESRGYGDTGTGNVRDENADADRRRDLARTDLHAPNRRTSYPVAFHFTI